MKERPILFSGPMVRAIFGGRKTQTRRVIKPAPSASRDGEPYWNIGGYRAWKYRGISDPFRMGMHNPIQCPYGKPGDRIWVRETFRDATNYALGRVLYKADGDTCCGWKPAIHMPRELSRITMEITGVRVERLNEISDSDCRSEGYPKDREQWAGNLDPWLWYRSLWDSINANRGHSWDSNPWVWVVEFKRIEK